MMSNKKTYAIVCPLANESATIVSFYEAINQVLAQYAARHHISIYFVIDRASTDNTKALVSAIEKQDAKVTLVWAPQSKNVVDAYVAGFETALIDGADFIIEMDGGFSHSPTEIPLFIDQLNNGFDCVFGSRFIAQGGLKTTPKRLFFSKFGTFIAKILLGLKLKDATSGFEAFTAQTLKKILAQKFRSTGHFIQTEIRFRCRHLNYTEVPINYQNPSDSLSLKSIANSCTTLLYCMKQRL